MLIKAPNDFSDAPRPWVFLAGSIEMGNAPPWRGEVAPALLNGGWTVLNPWRDDWDNSWQQSLDDANFCEQVGWELDALEACDAVLMYFAPGTTAPITLLKLGLCARSKKLLVCCPDDYWRKGNVDVVCDRYGVEQIDTLREAIERLVSKVS